MMYKISIIVCIVLMVAFIGVLSLEFHKDKQLEEQREEAFANLLLVESKQKPLIIEMTRMEKREILILTHEEATELERRPSIGVYAYIMKDMPWPTRPSLFAGKFIEWLYGNDYAIVKKEDK